MSCSTVIIDDEPMALKSLERLCRRNDHIDLIANFDDSVSALEYLNKHPVDLVILDINMPELSGIDLVAKLNFSPMILFSTGSPDHVDIPLSNSSIKILAKPLNPINFSMVIRELFIANKVIRDFS